MSVKGFRKMTNSSGHGSSLPGHRVRLDKAQASMPLEWESQPLAMKPRRTDLTGDPHYNAMQPAEALQLFCDFCENRGALDDWHFVRHAWTKSADVSLSALIADGVACQNLERS